MSETAPSASAEWKRHWPLVAAATSGMSLAALATAAFGVMLVPIANDTGWSRTEISLGPSLISFVVICCATMFGAAIDKFGPRLIAIAAVILLCGATAMTSQIGDQVWQWWAIWAVIGLCSAVMPTVWVSPVTNAFSAGRGLAMAVVLSGSGITSLIAPNLANGLVEAYGWRTAYLYLAAIWFVVVFVLVVLFLRTPRNAKAQAQPDDSKEQAPVDAPAANLPGLTASQGFRSAKFYKLLAAAVVANFAGIAIMLNLVPILRENGLDPAMAAAAFSSLGIATIIGRIIAGGLLDRFAASRVAITASLLMAMLPIMILAFPGNLPASIFGIFVYGMMGGALMPSISYLASRHLGQRAFGTLYATIMAAMSIGIGLGPVIANAVFDTVGSYDPVLWGALPLFAIGAILFGTLGAYPVFEEREI